MKGIGTGRLSAEHSPKYTRVERERRYLLRELPPGLKLQAEHAQITDNYITGTRLRSHQRPIPVNWKIPNTVNHQ